MQEISHTSPLKDLISPSRLLITASGRYLNTLAVAYQGGLTRLWNRDKHLDVSTQIPFISKICVISTESFLALGSSSYTTTQQLVKLFINKQMQILDCSGPATCATSAQMIIAIGTIGKITLYSQEGVKKQTLETVKDEAVLSVQLEGNLLCYETKSFVKIVKLKSNLTQDCEIYSFEGRVSNLLWEEKRLTFLKSRNIHIIQFSDDQTLNETKITTEFPFDKIAFYKQNLIASAVGGILFEFIKVKDGTYFSKCLSEDDSFDMPLSLFYDDQIMVTIFHNRVRVLTKGSGEAQNYPLLFNGVLLDAVYDIFQAYILNHRVYIVSSKGFLEITPTLSQPYHRKKVHFVE